MTKIGDGPKENKRGIASIETEVFGRKNTYSISGKELSEVWQAKNARRFQLRKLK